MFTSFPASHQPLEWLCGSRRGEPMGKSDARRGNASVSHVFIREVTGHAIASKEPRTAPPLLAHGADQLSRVIVDAYNAELRSADGFVGDRASKRAFQAILDDWRERVQPGRRGSARRNAQRGDQQEAARQGAGRRRRRKPPASSTAPSRSSRRSSPAVIRRFLRLKDWKDTERIVVGGGLRQSRIGELAIGRTAVHPEGRAATRSSCSPIRQHPDHAGLIGSVHLVPSWILAGHDSILAVDIGGSNIRAGIVELRLQEEAGPLRGRGRPLRALAPSRRRAEARGRRASASSRCSTDLIKRAEQGWR